MDITRLRSALRATMALGLTVGLAACGSSGGGGAGGGAGGGQGAGTIAEHKALFARYTDTTDPANAPTSDMPSSGGSAAYTGTVVTDIRDSSNAMMAEVIGDVALDVQFGSSTNDGQEQTPVTGRVHNIRGTDAAGKDFAWTAELTTGHSVAAAAGGGTLLTNQSTVNAPIVGPQTVRTGSMMVNLSGDIDATNAPDLGASGTALMTLGGSCFGPQCARSVGTASVTIDDNAQPGISNLTGSGTYVVER